MRNHRTRCLAWLLAIGLGCQAAGPARAADAAAIDLQHALQGRLATPVKPQIRDELVPLGVARFYADRQWMPVWDDVRFGVLLQQLADLTADGLNPEDYGLATLETLRHVDGDPARTSEREQRATRAYLMALIDLWHGKTDPRQLDPHWNFTSRQLDPLQGLALARTAVETGGIAAFFQRARPTLPQYARVQSALARLRDLARAGGWPVIPPGPALKPGVEDARIPLLRQRLEAAGLLAANPARTGNRYDPELVTAVQRFQRESYQQADGVLGAATLRELNIPVAQRIGQLRANLERMRWFGQGIRDDAVIVDVAGFRIAYLHNGEVTWQSRVQVGKAFRKTPIFQSEINRITLSPAWTVPPTILQHDSLPAIRRNPAYLVKNHLRVLDAGGKDIPAGSVNWSNPGKITLRQAPGPGAALGQMAIRFPNDYSVYLHDTPHKELFAKDLRTFSSGCIRVENVLELGLLLLNDPVAWSREALDRALETHQTREVLLPKKVPIFIAYWTVDVGQDGYVSFKPDIYRQDPQIVAALDAAP